MTNITEPPHASGPARAEIERASTAAGTEAHVLPASDLAMLEAFHVGHLATVAPARPIEVILAAKVR